MPTGEWTDVADWLSYEDTEAEHYDTYEPVTNTGDPTGPTRALIVRWTRPEAPHQRLAEAAGTTFGRLT